jgi:hypothetical protein
MIANWPRRALVSLIAVGAVCALTLGGTVSAYTSSVTTASNAFTAAADWTPPTSATQAIGRSTAYDTGFIDQGATYYVYANVSDTGSPASGTASVTANVSSITSGSTAAPLTSGTYSAGGVAYGYRSAALTAPATLTAGSRSYTITSTDQAANAATQSFTTVVDNTVPTGVDVQSTNVSGGAVGRLDKGDTMTLTYSDTMDPYSILAGWTGAPTNVQVALVDGGGTASDYVQVYSPDATPSQLTQIPIGNVYLPAGYLTAGTYISYGLKGTAVPSTMTRNGASITIVLGTLTGSPATSTTAAHLTWIPSASATDIAGNAAAATTATQSGTVHVNF